MKTFGGTGQQKVEGAKAKDREDIGREHNQRLARQRENRGHGVNGKHDVAYLNEQQNQ